MKKFNNYTKILEECIKVANERQKQYGMTQYSMKKASDICKTAFNLNLSKSDVAKVLISLKLSRETFNHKDDNILDCINYFAISLNEREEENNHE